MATSTCIRTENKLGDCLSPTFQSLIHGPELDGENCELNQISTLLNVNLKPLTIRNYSGLWDESEFPDDPFLREELIEKQKKEDSIWNDINEFEVLINSILLAITNKKLAPEKLVHQQDWWIGYFNLEPSSNSDLFINDLKIILDFLKVRKREGDTKVAFYISE